ncbi:MAG: 3-phosphoshikimate 1-carboxyvinyltransferase [Desulfobacteraceae bacterium]|nr:MAG: 3-phosphoshikimate 1-carboxyvinyltransferase [Desulfobacteraceae bacterium]
MIAIQPAKITKQTISVPGSKSYTHRMLIAAALSGGLCTLANCLRSQDTLLTLNALRQFGIPIEADKEPIIVHGHSGRLKPSSEPIRLENSGTSMRLLTAVAALGTGTYLLTGSRRMQERPIQDLLDGLSQIGISVRAIHENGCPPVEIAGGRIAGGRTVINCEKSSQFLSGLLLVAPYTEKGLIIDVSHGPVSKPYVDMTVEVMEKFGVALSRDGYRQFKVGGGQIYRSGTYEVEADASQAGYFWAAAAVTGGDIRVPGVSRWSKQGDVRLVDLLEKMGCGVFHEADGIRVVGGPLKGIDADMGDMPDMVPTLAVTAAFAKGTTVIGNVAHLAEKESDRLAAVSTELKKMGIEVKRCGTGLSITGGAPRGASIHTYNDHRIAMSFAVAGLRVPGIVIEEEHCVEKSFPEFWEVFQKLYDR